MRAAFKKKKKKGLKQLTFPKLLSTSVFLSILTKSLDLKCFKTQKLHVIISHLSHLMVVHQSVEGVPIEAADHVWIRPKVRKVRMTVTIDR